jgi:hypothetical protein
VEIAWAFLDIQKVEGRTAQKMCLAREGTAGRQALRLRPIPAASKGGSVLVSVFPLNTGKPPVS